jgi:hypothetical protein
MSNGIEDSLEYQHMVAQGIPPDVAWGAAWIDRAYNHLVRNGMSGAQAYAQAVSTWAVTRLDFDAITPEQVIYDVMEQGHKAQQKFPSLDPQQPEASFVLQHRPKGQAQPS